MDALEQQRELLGLSPAPTLTEIEAAVTECRRCPRLVDWREEVADTLQTFRVRRRRLPDNNADLSVYGLYTLQQHLYARAYAACNDDMPCLIRTLRAVASDPDPETSLAENLRGTRRRERLIR